MKMRKLFAGIAAAATLLGGMALGATSAQADEPQATTPLLQVNNAQADHTYMPHMFATFANAGNGGRTWSAMEPLRTQCAGVKGGHFAMVAPILAGVGGRAGQTEPRPADQPHYTFTAKGDCAVVSAFLEQACGGYYDGAGHDLRRPVPTICAKGSIQRLVSVSMEQRRCAGCGTCAPAPGCGDLCRDCWDACAPDLRAGLTAEQEAGALRVAAFLVNYYGNGTALDLREPMDTITTRDRMALVTVMVQGTPYVIVDIKLRMLKPAELFRAQGFPADYVIDRTADGRPISGTHAVRMVGNSVSPPPLRALAGANLDPVEELRMAA